MTVARLTGKVAVVTGSGQGIGRAIALLLAAEGAAVVVNSRTAQSPDGTSTAADVAAEISAAGGRAEAVFVDAATMDGARSLVDGAAEIFGSVDIVVNNAGSWPTIRIDEMGESAWDEVMGVNLKSAYAMAHYAVPRMRKGGWGRILTVISRVGLVGAATMSAYSASKAGAMGLTFALAKELAGDGITVNCLAPTANTARSARTAAERHAMVGLVVPASAERTPERIAPLAVYLASQAAADITGQVFYAAAGEVTLYSPPEPRRSIFAQDAWTLDDLDRAFPSAFGTVLNPPEVLQRRT